MRPSFDFVQFHRFPLPESPGDYVQVMAIATLALCFNNYDVFEKNVKIRKGLAVKLMSMSNSMDNVKLVFREFTHAIARKLRLDDPMAFEISKNLAKVDALCKS